MGGAGQRLWGRPRVLSIDNDWQPFPPSQPPSSETENSFSNLKRDMTETSCDPQQVGLGSAVVAHVGTAQFLRKRDRAV